MPLRLKSWLPGVLRGDTRSSQRAFKKASLTYMPRNYANKLQERIISNFQQVELSQDDISTLNELGKKNRTRFVSFIRLLLLCSCSYSFNIPHHYTPRWNINIFNEPEEETATNKPLVS